MAAAATLHLSGQVTMMAQKGKLTS